MENGVEMRRVHHRTNVGEPILMPEWKKISHAMILSLDASRASPSMLSFLL
jgi:hypothetical protein